MRIDQKATEAITKKRVQKNGQIGIGTGPGIGGISSAAFITSLRASLSFVIRV
jgi:hypothetical protein